MNTYPKLKEPWETVSARKFGVYRWEYSYILYTGIQKKAFLHYLSRWDSECNGLLLFNFSVQALNDQPCQEQVSSLGLYLFKRNQLFSLFRTVLSLVNGFLTAAIVICLVLVSSLVTTHQLYLAQRSNQYIKDKEAKDMVQVRASRVSKIFISHMHGDHIYGLPVLLTDIGLSRTHPNNKITTPVEIFGPPGLSLYLKTVFQLTDTRSSCPCIVHELYKDENDPRLELFDSKLKRIQYEDRRISVEPLFPSDDGFWTLHQVQVRCLFYHLELTWTCSCWKRSAHNRLLWLCLYFPSSTFWSRYELCSGNREVCFFDAFSIRYFWIGCNSAGTTSRDNHIAEWSCDRSSKYRVFT